MHDTKSDLHWLGLACKSDHIQTSKLGKGLGKSLGMRPDSVASKPECILYIALLPTVHSQAAVSVQASET